MSALVGQSAVTDEGVRSSSRQHDQISFPLPSLPVAAGLRSKSWDDFKGTRSPERYIGLQNHGNPVTFRIEPLPVWATPSV